MGGIRSADFFPPSILNSVIWVSLIEKMTFEQILERGDEVSHMDIWGKTVPNRNNILGVF